MGFCEKKNSTENIMAMVEPFTCPGNIKMKFTHKLIGIFNRFPVVPLFRITIVIGWKKVPSKLLLYPFHGYVFRVFEFRKFTPNFLLKKSLCFYFNYFPETRNSANASSFFLIKNNIQSLN